MKLRVKFRTEDQHRTYCRYFQTILLSWWRIFDGTNIQRTAIYEKTFIDVSRIMITYFISSNLCKKSSQQCYQLYNCPFFRNSHWRCSVRKGALGNFAKFTGKYFWSFSCLLLKIFCLFHPNRKWDEKREIPWWSSNIYFFA